MLAPTVRSSLLIAAMALLGFCGVAFAVAKVPAVSAFDDTVAVSLNKAAKASSASVEVFRWITALGTTPFLSWLSLAVIFILLTRRHWQLASAWIICLLLVALLVQRSKLAFGRARPGFNGEFAREDSLSFPSGHAMASMVVFGLLAYFFSLATTDRWLRRFAFVLSGALIVLIGFSRMYLGVHYLSDVIGGYLLGGVWLAFSIALIEDVRQHYRVSRMSGGQ
jgi:membrane-associated phospholipid phosphatase